ncbi:MAG TPA: TonB-dependent receptor [Chitinophagales bacterium]|nr:TonB-dependent receptor [Chitinophagales bacterium]
MKSIAFFLLIFFVAAGAFSQTTISGKITDQKGQPVTGANIFLKNTYDGTSSDANGKFSFTTSETDSQTLVVSYVGFETMEKKILCEGNSLEEILKLKEIVNELNVVVVSAGSFEASDAKRVTILRPLDIVTTAGAGGDTYGALQTLPGTQHMGNETGLFVRGGDASETKTFIDGVAIENPYFSDVPDVPQRGRFSPFLFKGTIFSTGGYSAQYGGAMSSAVILESQDLPARTTTNISLMSVGLGVGHEQLFAKKKTSLGVYVSYINLLPYFEIAKQRYDYNTPPESASGSIIFRQKTSKTGIVKAFVNFSPTRIEVSYPYTIDSADDHFMFSNKNKNLFAQASYKELIAKHWTLFTSFSYSNNNNEILLNKKDSITSLTSLAQGRITISRPIGSLSSLRFGAEVQHPHYEDTFNQFTSKIDDDYSAQYAEGDFYLTKKLVARLGARLEFSSLLNTGNVSPRASVAYKTGELSQVSFAYGQFYQVPDRIFLFTNDPISLEHADHYIINYQSVSERRTFRVEAYYKTYHDLIRTVPDTASTGDGFARGFDVFFRDKKTIKHADYWISYSFLDTKRNYLYYPEAITPPFAAKHTLSVVYKQYIPKINSSFSITYVFATKRTYLNPYNPILPGDKLPDYNNLSVSASYLTTIFKNFAVFVVGAQNVLGIDNIVGYRYIDDGAPIEVKMPALRSYFVGLFMTIGEDKGLDE